MLYYILHTDFHSSVTLVPIKGIQFLFFYGTVAYDPCRHASYYSAKVNGTLVKDVAWLVLFPVCVIPVSVISCRSASGFIPSPPPNSKLKADMHLIKYGNPNST